MRLAGKIAIVMGGGAGMGEAVAKAYGRGGVHTVAGPRTPLSATA